MNRLVLLLTIGITGMGLVTLHLVRELRAERTRTLALQTELDKVRSAPPEYKPEQVEAPTTLEQPAALEGSAPSPRGAKAAAVAVAGNASSVAMFGGFSSSSALREEQKKQFEAARERQQALMRDPAYRAAFIDQQKNAIRHMNAGVRRELGLTDEQYEQLLTVIAEHQVRMQEVMEPYFDGDPPDPGAMAEGNRRMQEIQQAQKQAMAELLGPQKLKRYQEYQAMSMARGQVTQLQNVLTESGLPLREEQMQPLIRLIHETNQRSMQHARNDFRVDPAHGPGSPGRMAMVEMQEQHLEQMRETNERIRSAAKGILSDEQTEALERQHDMQLEAMEAHLRMMRAQAEAEERGDIPPADQFGFQGNVIFSQ